MMLKFRARFKFQIEPWMSNRLGIDNPVELMLFALIYAFTASKTGYLITSYRVLRVELGQISENTLVKHLKILESKKLITREIMPGSGIYKYCAINWDKAVVGTIEYNEKEFCENCIFCVEMKPQICYCPQFLEAKNNFCQNFISDVAVTSASSFKGDAANVADDTFSSFEGDAANIAGHTPSDNKGGAANINTPPANFAGNNKHIKSINKIDYQNSKFYRPVTIQIQGEQQ